MANRSSVKGSEKAQGITLSETLAQPELWRKIFARLESLAPALRVFLAGLPNADLEVILAGAGSSAFVGEAVAPILQAKTGWRVRSVATTDIVTHPL